MSRALDFKSLLNTIEDTATAADVLTKDADGSTVIWDAVPAPTIPNPTTLDAACVISSNLVGWRDVPVVADWARGSCAAVTANITLDTSDMAAGYTLSVYNNSGSAINVIQGGGVTLRLGGTTSTGTRTLAPRGIATIWCLSGTEAIITGSGVS
jgi:hypothetical protein